MELGTVELRADGRVAGPFAIGQQGTEVGSARPPPDDHLAELGNRGARQEVHRSCRR